MVTCSRRQTSSCSSVCSSCRDDLGSGEELKRSRVPPLFREGENQSSESVWNTNNLSRCLQDVPLMGTDSCPPLPPSDVQLRGAEAAAVTGTCWTLFAFWRHHRPTPPLFPSPVCNPPWRGFWVPRTDGWTLRVRCSLCASHRPCKRQNHRLIFQTGPDWRLRVQ